VKVLRVDEERQKISLGLKQLAEDPWSRVASTYTVGQVVNGHITRLAEFGAFVELEPGVEALAHASTFAAIGESKRWREAVPVGTTAPFEILSVDVNKKRIGVALVPEGSTRGRAAESQSDANEQREYIEREQTASAKGFGSLADKLRHALKGRD